MTDMLGRTIELGSLVIMPDGNVRYGGLYIRAGRVVSMTEKTVSVKSVKIENSDKAEKQKVQRKTPSKLIVIDDMNLDEWLDTKMDV